GVRDMCDPPEVGYGESVDLVPFEEDSGTVALIINESPRFDLSPGMVPGLFSYFRYCLTYRKKHCGISETAAQRNSGRAGTGMASDQWKHVGRAIEQNGNPYPGEHP